MNRNIPNIVIRSIGGDDRHLWEPLWAGYLDFYERTVAPEVSECTWSRLTRTGRQTLAFYSISNGPPRINMVGTLKRNLLVERVAHRRPPRDCHHGCDLVAAARPVLVHPVASDVTYTAGVQFGTLTFLLVFSFFAADKHSAIPVVRWAENAPGCSIQEGEDGRSNYTFSTIDYDITLAVDRQELEKIPHRATPMLGVLLSFHYKGSGKFVVEPQRFTLEFVKHRRIVHHSLSLDGMLRRLQENIDDVTDDTERHRIKKHPEQKHEEEAKLQARLKDYTEMMDFISTHALHSTTLDPSEPSVAGWVFFGIKDKFIGPWHKPEEFVLRLPAKKSLIEFPFSLPPKNGKVQLRSRPE